MHTLATTLLAASLMLSKTILAAPAHSEWCTFFEEDLCLVRSGTLNFDIANYGTFQNSGGYFSCKASSEFSLLSYPAGDPWGSNPEHCYVWPRMGKDQCVRLDNLGFDTSENGWYRLSYDKICPPTSNKQRSELPEVEQLEESETSNSSSSSLAPRSKKGWLTFYDDPACQEQVGSVHYSIKNDGCFENSGAYAYYSGNDADWHLEQWTGEDNAMCSGTLVTCRTAGDINFSAAGGGCVHLDDAGFSTGNGSYRIAYAGCA